MCGIDASVCGIDASVCGIDARTHSGRASADITAQEMECQTARLS
jgi:hypothetical protein